MSQQKQGIPFVGKYVNVRKRSQGIGRRKRVGGGGAKVSGSKGLLLLEVANSSARSRKMEVFIKGINAERNIHISYAEWDVSKHYDYSYMEWK